MGNIGKVVVGTFGLQTVRSVRFQFPKLKFVGPDVLTGSKQKKIQCASVNERPPKFLAFWGGEVCVSRVVSYRIVEGDPGKVRTLIIASLFPKGTDGPSFAWFFCAWLYLGSVRPSPSSGSRVEDRGHWFLPGGEEQPERLGQEPEKRNEKNGLRMRWIECRHGDVSSHP